MPRDDDHPVRAHRLDQQVACGAEGVRTRAGAWVVQREDDVAGDEGGEPVGQDLPRLEVVAEVDQRVVAAEHRTDEGARSVGRRHAGHDVHGHVRVRGLLDRRDLAGLEECGRHPEDPCIAARDERDVLTVACQVEGEAPPVQLDGVAGGVPGQTLALRHPRHVRRVADDVRDPPQDLARLGGEPVLRSRAESDDVHGAGS